MPGHRAASTARDPAAPQGTAAGRATTALPPIAPVAGHDPFARSFDASAQPRAISDAPSGVLLHVDERRVETFGVAREEAVGRVAGDLVCTRTRPTATVHASDERYARRPYQASDRPAASVASTAAAAANSAVTSVSARSITNRAFSCS